MSLSYPSYLKLDELLGSHKPVSPSEHDEMLFIIIHQTYELWFKQLLHEGDDLGTSLAGGDVYRSLATFKRMLKILKTIVGQVDILETMTPVSFQSFRSRLENAGGFQSWQLRCLESLLGLRQKERLQSLPKETPEYKKLESYVNRPSLYDSFLVSLHQAGYAIPSDVLERDMSVYYEGDERVQKVLTDVYRNDPQKALLCELFVDLDEGVQEWRYRHVKMVERTIGDRTGTGGSMGASYLKHTLSRFAFVDLWKIRSSL